MTARTLVTAVKVGREYLGRIEAPAVRLSADWIAPEISGALVKGLSTLDQP